MSKFAKPFSEVTAGGFEGIIGVGDGNRIRPKRKYNNMQVSG